METVEEMRRQMEELRSEAEDKQEEGRRDAQQSDTKRRNEQRARDIAKASELKQLNAGDGTNFAHWIEGVETFLYGWI